MKACKVISGKEAVKAHPIKDKEKGMIHSFETFGCLDGPGLRFVIFLEGCPLRCVYCHNRDMLDLKDYQVMTAKQLLDKVKDYKPYFGKEGGVTISGGDPVYQPHFVLNFLKLAKKEKISVALDTSLFTSKKVIDQLFPYVDIFMTSLKHFDNELHRCLTGVPNTVILKNQKYLAKKIGTAKKGHKPRLWFRYVVLPGYTDTKKNLDTLVDFLHEVNNFELIDLLPYHTYGMYKWKKLGLKYALKGVKPPSMKKMLNIKKMLEKEGFKVLLNG